MTDTFTASPTPLKIKKPFYPEGYVGAMSLIFVLMATLLGTGHAVGLVNLSMFQIASPLIFGALALGAMPLLLKVFVPAISLLIVLTGVLAGAILFVATVALGALGLLIASPFQPLHRFANKVSGALMDSATKAFKRATKAMQ